MEFRLESNEETTSEGLDELMSELAAIEAQLDDISLQMDEASEHRYSGQMSDHDYDAFILSQVIRHDSVVKREEDILTMIDGIQSSLARRALQTL